jgi:hypothetical protein
MSFKHSWEASLYDSFLHSIHSTTYKDCCYASVDPFRRHRTLHYRRQTSSMNACSNIVGEQQSCALVHDRGGLALVGFNKASELLLK